MSKIRDEMEKLSLLYCSEKTAGYPPPPAGDSAVDYQSFGDAEK